jgi:hypothetical protein
MKTQGGLTLSAIVHGRSCRRRLGGGRGGRPRSPSSTRGMVWTGQFHGHQPKGGEAGSGALILEAETVEQWSKEGSRNKLKWLWCRRFQALRGTWSHPIWEEFLKHVRYYWLIRAERSSGTLGDDYRVAITGGLCSASAETGGNVDECLLTPLKRRVHSDADQPSRYRARKRVPRRTQNLAAMSVCQLL